MIVACVVDAQPHQVVGDVRREPAFIMMLITIMIAYFIIIIIVTTCACVCVACVKFKTFYARKLG